MQGSPLEQRLKEHRKVERAAAGQKEPGSVSVQTEIQMRKPRGRLSREDQRRLGDILQRVYDDVVKQGVPERFVRLMGRIDQSTGLRETGDISPGPLSGATGSPAASESEREKPKDRE